MKLEKAKDIVKIYLTDSQIIFRNLCRRFEVTPKAGIHQKQEFGQSIKVLLITRSSIYGSEELDHIDLFRAYKSNGNAIFYNCFEPTEEGALAFAVFFDKAGLQGKVSTLYTPTLIATDALQGLPTNPLVEQTDVLCLEKWTEWRLQMGYAQALQEMDITSQYDSKLFPVLQEIEKRRQQIDTIKDFNYTVQAEIKVGDFLVKGSLCDRQGKAVCVIDENFVTEDSGTIIEVAQTEKTVEPPLPYTYLELLKEAVTLGTPYLDAVEMLENFYANGMISYPKTSSKYIRPALRDKMVRLSQLAFAYPDFVEKLKYREIAAAAEKDTDYTAGGIVLLDSENLAKRYQDSPEQNVLDLLIKRQLCLYAAPAKEQRTTVIVQAGEHFFKIENISLLESGWKEIAYGELAASVVFSQGQAVSIQSIQMQPKLPELHTMSSLIKLLKIHAAAGELEIAEIMEKLEKCPLVDKIGAYYLVRKCDIEILGKLPNLLKSIDEMNRPHRYVIQEIMKNKKTKSVYKEWIGRGVAEVIENMKGAQNENRCGKVERT